jgi:hypothetical protein
MPRFASLRALTAATLLALVLPASAAEATRVASSGDEENPFDLDFTVRFDYQQNRALITREYTYDYAGASPTPLGAVEERPELRYRRRSTAIVPRFAVGIYKDLEVHLEIPYVLDSNATWRYAFRDGAKLTDADSATGRNDVNPDGTPCATLPCPAVTAIGESFRGTRWGDLKIGAAWGILSDARDDTKPFWLIGVDFTFPTSRMNDPYLAPSYVEATPGPFGDEALKVDFITALSKRMGAVDPYVRFHATSYRASSDTYSNCDHLTPAPAACSESKYGARPPWIAGAAFGAEIVTGENKADGMRVALDFRLTADYVSASRWYNELTDATGKLLATEDYFNVQAFFGFYWRASKYMQLQATTHIGSETPHFITGESTGALDAAGKATNPNFDYRYDPAGRRYRVTEVSDFGVALSGVLQF